MVAKAFGFLLVVPRCVRATRWGRGVGDPGRPGIVHPVGRDHRMVGVDRSGSEVPPEAVPGVGAKRMTQEHGQSKSPWIAALSCDAIGSKRSGGGGRPCALLCRGPVGNWRVRRGKWESSLCERPHPIPEDTGPRPDHASSGVSMTPGWSSGGKRLAGKLHEPFERADGGRAFQPHLLRLYRPGAGEASEAPQGRKAGQLIGGAATRVGRRPERWKRVVACCGAARWHPARWRA
jgi:hypothetical protein